MMARRGSVLPKSFVRMVIAMVSLAVWVVVVVVLGAEPAAKSSTAAAPGENSGCLRPLSDVIWGFLITLLACTVAVWGVRKHTMSERGDKVGWLFVAIFAPVLGLRAFIRLSLHSAVLNWMYNKLCRNLSPPIPARDWYGHLKMLWSWVSPFSESLGRIFFRCDVVVYAAKESCLLHEDWLWENDDGVKDVSEAMVIGEVADGKTQNGHYERKGLSIAGKTAFMLADIVPKYDELKFLRGNSGFAIIAFAIQALGYIYAVVFQQVKDLRVTPLEVIGLILNVVLLMEVSVYGFFNPCHRPLVIYLNSWREEKLHATMVCVKKEVILKYNRQCDAKEWMFSVAGVVCMCLGGVVVYFSVTFSRVSNILVVLPLIIFVVASITLTFDLVPDSVWYSSISIFSIP